jgi:Rad3-related DNA helicase
MTDKESGNLETYTKALKEKLGGSSALWELFEYRKRFLNQWLEEVRAKKDAAHNAYYSLQEPDEKQETEYLIKHETLQNLEFEIMGRLKEISLLQGHT